LACVLLGTPSNMAFSAGLRPVPRSLLLGVLIPAVRKRRDG
jgi:hypothetical protein